MDNDYNRPAIPRLFSDKQFIQLAAHMKNEFPVRGEFLAGRLECDASLYIARIASDSEKAKELKERREYYQKHADAIQTVIFGLQDIDMRYMRGRTISEVDLRHRMADCLDSVKDYTRQRGGPKKNGRARLIRDVYRVYGGRAKRTKGSHFETTVGIIIGFIDPPPILKDVHKAIIDALK